jgi:hypothetical protein
MVTVATDRFDLAFPTSQGTDPDEWRDLGYLYLPGTAHQVVEGDRVWLRHRDRFFHSYEIVGQEHWERRPSVIDGEERGPGPVVVLRTGSGRVEDKRLASIPDPDDVRDSWGRGTRYMSPGARRFVRIGARRSKVGRLPRRIPLDHGSTEPVEVVTKEQARTAERREAQLTVAFVEWMRGVDRFQSLALPISPSRDIRADMHCRELNVLIEVKASASRNHLRMAVGQLLDYVRLAHTLAGPTPQLAILVPIKPEPDLMSYLRSVDVAVIWRTGPGFADSMNGSLTKRFR